MATGHPYGHPENPCWARYFVKFRPPVLQRLRRPRNLGAGVRDDGIACTRRSQQRDCIRAWCTGGADIEESSGSSARCRAPRRQPEVPADPASRDPGPPGEILPRRRSLRGDSVELGRLLCGRCLRDIKTSWCLARSPQLATLHRPRRTRGNVLQPARKRAGRFGLADRREARSLTFRTAPDACVKTGTVQNQVLRSVRPLRASCQRDVVLRDRDASGGFVLRPRPLPIPDAEPCAGSSEPWIETESRTFK